MPEAQQWSEPLTTHGEGPIWNSQIGRFQLVDMLAGDVLTMHHGEQITRLHVDTVAAVVRPRQDGGLLIAGERDIFLIDGDGEQELVPGAGVPQGSRFNEGSCSPDGSFWVGSMAYDARRDAGIMVRLDPEDLSFTTVATDVTISNGLAFRSPHLAYYVDSETRRIDRLAVERDRIIGRAPWVDLSDIEGVPDGICMDVDGGVWVAIYGGGAVRRYDSEGKLTHEVTVPVAQVTACALGGRNGTELLITTSRLGMDGDAGPAGALFHADVDVPGVEVTAFGG